MCVTVFFGSQEIESQKQAREFFGRELIFEKMNSGDPVEYNPECCLCHVDVEEMAKAAGYAVEYDPSWPAFELSRPNPPNEGSMKP